METLQEYVQKISDLNPVVYYFIRLKIWLVLHISNVTHITKTSSTIVVGKNPTSVQNDIILAQKNDT